mmetsp:Transcript_1914/g.4844  ORF Transcript_1914/g.4844 Transcript_1914/m.4844 type:complete len:210 (+) Transcript_1914:708-1337(+)
MPVPRDALHIWHVLEAVDQSLVVGVLLLLAWQGHSQLLGGLGLPHTDIHVIAATEHVCGIATEPHCEHALHALCSIYLSGVTTCVREYAHATIVRPCHKLSSSRGVVHVHDSRYKVLMHAQCARELAHVIRVQAAIFIGDGEVEGLHRVPCQRVASCLHDDFADGRCAAQVKQGHTAIAASGGKQVCLRRVEARRGHRVGAPSKAVSGL